MGNAQVAVSWASAGWAGVSLTCLGACESASVWINGVQGPGSGANAIDLPVRPLSCTPTHTHTGAQADQTTADQDRPRRAARAARTGPLNLTPGHRSSAAAAGCLVEPTQAASSSTPSPPSARTASCPSNTRSFSGILLDVCPRTPCFLFLAAPGSPGRKLCHIVVSSTAPIQVSRMLFAPLQALKPKAKRHLGRATPQLAVCPRRVPSAMPCHPHVCCCPATRRPACHLIAPGARGWTACFRGWRSDLGSQSSPGSGWDGHGGQGRQTSEHSASAAPRPRRRGTTPNMGSALSTTVASPDTSHPLPAFSTGDQREPPPGGPGSAEELLC